MKTIAAVAITILGCLISAFPEERALGQEKLYLATCKPRNALAADAPPKLAPALIATLDAEGTLKGADDRGRPVISVPEHRLKNFAASAAIHKFTAEVPEKWKPVKRLIINYAPGDAPSANDLERLGLRLVEDYEKGAFVIAEPFNETIDAKLVRKLQESDDVRYASPLFRVKAISPRPKVKDPPPTQNSQSTPPTNDIYWSKLWGLRSISAPAAWKKRHDTSTIVAVIDTGVDYEHPDLKQNMWTNLAGEHGYDFVANDPDPMDEVGHGTHCAGTIGAVGNNALGVVGVNWKIQIMAVRWLDRTESGEVSDAVKSIDYAVDHGAKILCNSWYYPYDEPSLEGAIKRARNKGVLFVVAASNFGDLQDNNGGDNDQGDTFGRYPSSYPLDNIVAVAAVQLNDRLATFSNWGRRSVHLAAPGVNIYSTWPRAFSGDQPYEYDSGTSMAAPHVAGAAALLYPTLASGETSPAGIRQQLMDNVRKLPALKDKCVSEGALDVEFLKQ